VRVTRALSPATIGSMNRDWRKTAREVPEFASRVGLERRIAKLAGAQHGVVSLAQLQECGLGSRAVRARVSSGRLHRIHSGVYAVGHPLLTGLGRYMAAVLASGDRALLSYRSAADLWGLRKSDRARIDITSPAQGGRARRGIQFHRTAGIAAADATIHEGVPCTSVARTLLDLARVVDRRALERACDQAEVLRLFDLGAVHELLCRIGPVAGSARLRAVLDEHEIGSTMTRSHLEEAFLALCERAALPRPEVNARLVLEAEAFEVDFLWRAARLVVETDGYAYHRTGWAQERDRRRDQLLSRSGWRRERFTFRQITADPGWVTDTLRLLLREPPTFAAVSLSQ
jgi:predicted transcriptional regulator of viral defense system